MVMVTIYVNVFSELEMLHQDIWVTGLFFSFLFFLSFFLSFFLFSFFFSLRGYTKSMLAIFQKRFAIMILLNASKPFSFSSLELFGI